jgi:hypothetical protein
MLNFTVLELSVAEYSLTGTFTNPKLSVSDAIDRAAIESSVERGGASYVRCRRQGKSAEMPCGGWL